MSKTKDFLIKQMNARCYDFKTGWKYNQEYRHMNLDDLNLTMLQNHLDNLKKLYI